MAKYDPLHRFLRRARATDEIVLTFADIERIIGAILPKAAKDPAWWSNPASASCPGVQQKAWMEAGFQARPGPGETVTFSRAPKRPGAEAPHPSAAPSADV